MDFNRVARFTRRKPRIRGKIYKYTSRNVYFDKITRRLTIYNGIHTSPVIKRMYLGSYMFSLTASGNIYITLPPISYRSK